MPDSFTAALDYAAVSLLAAWQGSRGPARPPCRNDEPRNDPPLLVRSRSQHRDSDGAASKAWVLDIDGEEGEQSLSILERQHGDDIPKTHIVITSRGRHVWLAYRGTIPSSAGRIGPGLDVRADGGYAIAPPSVHETGHVYSWAGDPHSPLGNPPAWLIIAARKRPAKLISERALSMVRPPPGRAGSFGHAALCAEISALSGTAPGSRNHALNRAAFNLFQLVAGGELAESEMIAALEQACIINGLIHDTLHPSGSRHTRWTTS
jgi:hypothetical protein